MEYFLEENVSSSVKVGGGGETSILFFFSQGTKCLKFSRSTLNFMENTWSEELTCNLFLLWVILQCPEEDNCIPSGADFKTGIHSFLRTQHLQTQFSTTHFSLMKVYLQLFLSTFEIKLGRQTIYSYCLGAYFCYTGRVCKIHDLTALSKHFSSQYLRQDP